MNGHDGAVRSLSLTFDSKLISGAEDKLIKVWDLANYQCVNTLKGHDDYLRVVKGLKNGRIASGARDNTLKVWNVQTNTCEISLKGHSLPIWSILEIQIDKILATGSADFTIKIWDM
jgi:WD40 repeat protein